MFLLDAVHVTSFANNDWVATSLDYARHQVTTSASGKGEPAGDLCRAVPASNSETVWKGILGRSWSERSLLEQFLLLGTLVCLVSVAVIGGIVTSLIRNEVTRNAAATTALYVDSVIAPLLPDMQRATELDYAVRLALDETLRHGALGSQLAEMRVWAPDGTVLYSDNAELIGRRFPLGDGLSRAFRGDLVADYNWYDDLGEAAAHGNEPLLEIYNPIRQPWSGEVVAVIEFYEFAGDLQSTLRKPLVTSWVAVAGTITLLFLALFATVYRASRTIDRQATDLNSRVRELTQLLETNRTLHKKAQTATQRAAARNERFLRRVGADLHDGPAQLVALAALRLDSDLLLNAGGGAAPRQREVEAIRSILDDALGEIRAICHGLVLPQLESASPGEIIEQAITAHEQRTGIVVQRQIAPIRASLPLPHRICLYRFLQEALNNGNLHASGATQTVIASSSASGIVVTVSDDGPGFDPGSLSNESLGIFGLRDRVESLGGRFSLVTGPAGTTLTMELNLHEDYG